MPETISFHRGLDAATPADKLEDGFIAAGSNIDFSLEPGAARARRGVVIMATGISTSTVDHLFRHYTDPGISASPYYAQSGSNMYRSTNGSNYTVISTLVDANADTGQNAYRDYTYMVNGSMRIKDNGTTALEWGVQYPGTAPIVIVSTITGLAVGTAWSVVEGVAGGTTGTLTMTTDASTFRGQANVTVLNTNLDTNGGAAIGDYGVDYLDIYVSDPKSVSRISRDYSIGDQSFTNYWHTELWVTEDILDALPKPPIVTDAILNVDGTNVDNDTRQLALSRARRYYRPTKDMISAAIKDGTGVVNFNPWAVPRTEFQLVGRAVNNGWASIQAARVVVESTLTGGLEVRIRNWEVRGDSAHPLNDTDVGYAWWETWAAIDTSGNVLWESAPSPPTQRVKSQGGAALIALVGTATGTSHGFTHRLVYRQGGYLPAPYRVGTFTGTTASTFTDTVGDIPILVKNQPMQAEMRSTLPSNCVAISEPFYDRLFLGTANGIIWSLPGNPHGFPLKSYATVSHAGDNVHQLIVWPPGLVIINRDSVYELTGSIFEGPSSDFTLQRSGSRHGSAARRACIKTDFGILLLNQDGFYMYVPSQGVDQPIVWANERLKPMFSGYGAADPAILDGTRVPPITLGSIWNSCAAYREGKIYVGVPTAGNTVPDTLVVLDMVRQVCYYYKYPWSFRDIFWDLQDNSMLIGGVDGNIYRAEIGVNDTLASGTQTAVNYSVKSRMWTTPSDTVLENASVEYRNGTTTVLGLYDGTTTATVGTLATTGRNWSTPALLGSVSNNVQFNLVGKQSDAPASLYAITYDALVEPVRVTYYRTPYDINDYNGEKLWDVHFTDMEIIGTGTVFGTAFIDNTAVATYTFTGPPGGRQVFPNSFPLETYGDVAHTIYGGVSGTLTNTTKFKLWKTAYAARNEPPRVNSWQTDKQSLDEVVCDGWDVDINPNGTVLGTVFVDNTAIATRTFTGTNRQSFTNAFRDASISAELFGRTIHANFTGTAFKHYNTWWHLRNEPDRWQTYVSDRESMDEAITDAFDADIDCLGSTVLATAMVDGAAVGTYTLSGSGRQSFTRALPNETYGRTVWVVYNVSGGGRAKHYRTWWHKRPEPDRWTNYVSDRYTVPSDHYAKTLVAELNPLGTVLATAFANGTAVGTATFAGTERYVYNWGFPNITYGAELHVVYNASPASATFKHYHTDYEVTPRPFSKKTWLLEYHKVGGASQLDLGRFFALEAEAGTIGGTATITSTWDIDGTAFQTNTFTMSGRQWVGDSSGQTRTPFLPGARGYLFQQRLSSEQDFRVWHSILDGMRVGIKGLARFQLSGKPT